MFCSDCSAPGSIRLGSDRPSPRYSACCRFADPSILSSSHLIPFLPFFLPSVLHFSAFPSTSIQFKPTSLCPCTIVSPHGSPSPTPVATMCDAYTSTDHWSISPAVYSCSWPVGRVTPTARSSHATVHRFSSSIPTPSWLAYLDCISRVTRYPVRCAWLWNDKLFNHGVRRTGVFRCGRYVLYVPSPSLRSCID